MAIDPRPSLLEIEKSLENNLGLDELRALRNRLDDLAFEQVIVEYYSQLHNDPDVKVELVNVLRRIFRRLEELRDRRKFETEQAVAIGVGGGISLVAGSIIAAVGAIFPLVILIPIFGGGYMAVRAFFGARQTNDERVAYGQMVERAKRLEARLNE